MGHPAQIGRFKVKRELGRGAMGIVYHGEDPILGRPVAIKAIQVNTQLESTHGSEITQRFENEARAAARLSHPNLVTIFEAGHDGDRLFLAMEMIDGVSLEDQIAISGALEPPRAAEIITQLASALDYAHASAIIHRDIKPANVLLSRQGTPKITDFGVARLEASTLTATGTIVGTPAYMAPEQITGRPVSGATDQFALAIVAYEMLTGKQPFGDEGTTRILRKIVAENPDPPATVRGTLPAAIDAVIAKALDKDPVRRYPSCAAFADAVSLALSGYEQAPVAAPAAPEPPAAEDAATRFEMPGDAAASLNVPADADAATRLEVPGDGEMSPAAGSTQDPSRFDVAATPPVAAPAADYDEAATRFVEPPAGGDEFPQRAASGRASGASRPAPSSAPGDTRAGTLTISPGVILVVAVGVLAIVAFLLWSLLTLGGGDSSRRSEPGTRGLAGPPAVSPLPTTRRSEAHPASTTGR